MAFPTDTQMMGKLIGDGNFCAGETTIAAGTIAVATGFNHIVSAVATFAEAPGAEKMIYHTISGGTVTFASAVDKKIQYQIYGRM